MRKIAPFLGESRCDVIFRHLRLYFRATGVSPEAYSVDVVRVWMERTPPGARHRDWVTVGDVFEQMKANGKKLRRWMSDEVSARPSVDVEESLVMTLPDPYRGECLRDLTLRVGGLYVAIPDVTTPILGDAAALLRDCGNALTALAPVLADGVIDERDCGGQLDDAERELIDVHATVAGLISRIRAAREKRAVGCPAQSAQAASAVLG